MKIETLSQFFNAIMDRNHEIHTNEWKKEVSNFGGVGYFPPDKVADRILRIVKEESIVRSRALVLPADAEGPDVPLGIPALKQGDDGITGRMVMSWFSENDMPDTDCEFEEVKYIPNELGGIIMVSDRLLRNTSDSYFDAIISDAVIDAEDEAFLVGSGLKKSLGVIHCPGRLEVDRAIANQISLIDVVNMLEKLLPQSIKKAVWVASQSALRHIVTMQDPSGQYVYKDGKILNIPVEFTDKTPVLGQRGDLMLCDFRYYVIKDGTGLRIAISNVAGFTQNKSQLRAIKNVDGHGLVKAPLKLKNGNYASPFVILK